MKNDGSGVRITYHSKERANERLSVKNTREFRRRVDLAFTRGKRVQDLKRSMDRRYLANKTDETCEAVAFDGVCYILTARRHSA